MNNRWNIQRNRITKLSLTLRRSYYDKHRCDECSYNTPHGIEGNITESIGSWPEFIFKGSFCKRTFQGFCSPCFYSQFPIDKKEKGIAYENMIRNQFNYVINNFFELVINRQYGKLNDDIVRFVLTPTGSFFDADEFPQKLRIELLEKLKNEAKKYNVQIQLHIESHCKDWNKLEKTTNDSIYEIQLLKELHTKILFGFESSNEYVRNVLYNKNLEMDDFLKAYKTAKKLNLDVGIFIFAGLFSMNDMLTIYDVKESINFAKENNITPVIMFQNVQQYTITDVLFRNDKIRLIEPFSVMEIVLYLLDKFGNSNWLIADPKGGPPVPEHNIFDSAKITSSENSKKIYDMIHELRITRDIEQFKTNANELKKTDNYSKYNEYLNSCRTWEYLETDTDNLLTCAEQIINCDN